MSDSEPRPYLYVPADNPDMLAKSLERHADALIVDLEDAVLPDRKEIARDTLVDWGNTRPDPDSTEILVRINPSDPIRATDIATVVGLPDLDGVVLAKAEDPAEIRQVRDSLPEHLELHLLIESARGLVNLHALAAIEGVERLHVGEADLSADLGTDFKNADSVLAPIRLQIVVASTAAGMRTPVGPVSTNFRDLGAFESSTKLLSQLGYGSRAGIHPTQIGIINQVFTPSDEAVDRARKLVAAAERGVTGVFLDDDGTLVDEAVLRAARKTVARASYFSEHT